MNNNKWIWIVLGVVVVLVIIIVMVQWSGPATPNVAQNTATGTTAGTSPSATPGPGKATGPVFPSNALTPGPDKTGPIHFISPPAGDRWPQQAQNDISWDHASGATGQLYLVDATTNKFIGTILNQVAGDQTHYTWNTRDLLVSRTNPAKITVATGNYKIVFSFDQNHLPTITSPAFTIVPPLPK